MGAGLPRRRCLLVRRGYRLGEVLSGVWCHVRGAAGRSGVAGVVLDRESFGLDRMSREDDARIGVWLGELIPWIPPLGQENLATMLGFHWTEPEFGKRVNWEQVRPYTTSYELAISLFPRLLAMGYRPMLGADTDERDHLTGDWRCKLWIPNSRFINTFHSTIAGAISGAVLELITRLDK